jgi:hypothetical protein
MNAHPEIVPSLVDRIKQTLGGLAPPQPVTVEFVRYKLDVEVVEVTE